MKIRILLVLGMIGFCFVMDHYFPHQASDLETEKVIQKDYESPFAKIYFDLDKYKATINENGEGYITVEKLELPTNIHGSDEARVQMLESQLVQRLKPPSKVELESEHPLSVRYKP